MRERKRGQRDEKEKDGERWRERAAGKRKSKERNARER